MLHIWSEHIIDSSRLPLPPDFDPQVVRVELVLKHFNLAYEKSKRESHHATVPSLKIEEKPGYIEDSRAIIEHLASKGHNLDASLSPEQAGIRTLLNQTLNCSLYFIILNNWVTHFDSVKEVLGHSESVFSKIFHNDMKSELHERLFKHGYGRHSEETLTQKGRKDLSSFSTLLGDKPYFFGDQPSSADLNMFAMLWHIHDIPVKGPLKSLLYEFPNLVSFVSRLKEKYFGIAPQPDKDVPPPLEQKAPEQKSDAPRAAPTAENPVTLGGFVEEGEGTSTTEKATADTSPFVLKLEIFLRALQIPYRKYKTLPPKSPTGKLPVVGYDGTFLSDSTLIVEWFNREFNLNLDDWLSPEQKAVGHLLQISLEESLYWLGLYFIFVTDDGYDAFKSTEAYNHAPFLVRHGWFPILRHHLGAQVKSQGYHLLPKEGVANIVRDSYSAYSSILGEKKYLFGDRISIYDVVLLSQLMAIAMADGKKSFTHSELLQEFPNLGQLCVQNFDLAKPRTELQKK